MKLIGLNIDPSDQSVHIVRVFLPTFFFTSQLIEKLILKCVRAVEKARQVRTGFIRFRVFLILFVFSMWTIQRSSSYFSYHVQKIDVNSKFESHTYKKLRCFRYQGSFSLSPNPDTKIRLYEIFRLPVKYDHSILNHVYTEWRGRITM